MTQHCIHIGTGQESGGWIYHRLLINSENESRDQSSNQWMIPHKSVFRGINELNQRTT